MEYSYIERVNCCKSFESEIKAVFDFRWGQVTISSALLNELLPGPVTVVFERTLNLNPELNPGTTLVGIRVPNHGFVRDVSRMCEEPLALTSANPSAAGSTLTIQVCIVSFTHFCNDKMMLNVFEFKLIQSRMKLMEESTERNHLENKMFCSLHRSLKVYGLT